MTLFFKVHSAGEVGNAFHIIGVASPDFRIWNGDILHDSENAALSFEVVSVALGGMRFIAEEIAITLVMHELPCLASEMAGRILEKSEKT